VLYGRTPKHAAALLTRLQSGDPSAAAAVGLPPELVAAQVGHAPDPANLDFINSLLNKAAFLQALNEAWMLLATLVAVGLVPLFLVRARRV